MTCKRSEQCDHADICRFAKSTEYNLLGGSCFTLKDPQTNEEWLRTATTEQLAEWLNNKIIICAVCDQQKSCEYLINETCHLCPFHEGKNKSWEVWLKQPHTTE